MWHLVGGGNNFPPTRHGLVGGGAWPPWPPPLYPPLIDALWCFEKLCVVHVHQVSIQAQIGVPPRREYSIPCHSLHHLGRVWQTRLGVSCEERARHRLRLPASARGAGGSGWVRRFQQRECRTRWSQTFGRRRLRHSCWWCGATRLVYVSLQLAVRHGWLWLRKLTADYVHVHSVHTTDCNLHYVVSLWNTYG